MARQIPTVAVHNCEHSASQGGMRERSVLLRRSTAISSLGRIAPIADCGSRPEVRHFLRSLTTQFRPGSWHSGRQHSVIKVSVSLRSSQSAAFQKLTLIWADPPMRLLLAETSPSRLRLSETFSRSRAVMPALTSMLSWSLRAPVALNVAPGRSIRLAVISASRRK